MNFKPSKIFTLISLSLFLIGFVYSNGIFKILPTFSQGIDLDFATDIGNAVQTRSLADRVQADSEALQNEGKEVEQLQQQDAKQCRQKMGLGGGEPPGGELGEAIQSGIADTIESTIEEKLPAAIRQEFTDRLPGAISRSISTNLSNTLSGAVRTQMESILPRVISERTQGGTTAITSNILQESLREALGLSVRAGMPEAIRSSMEIGLPEAIMGVSREAIPAAIEGILRNHLPAALEASLPGILNEQLSDGMFDELSDRAVDIEGLTDEVLSEINGNLMDEISTGVLESLNGEMDNLVADISTSFTGELDGLLDQNLDLFDNVANQISLELEGTLDLAINNSLGQLTGAMDGIINQTVGQLTGAMDGIINQTVGQLTGAMDTIIGSVLDPITGALSGVMDSVMAPITEAMDTVMSAVMDPITGAIDNVISTVMDPITGAIDNVVGRVTDSITGAAGDMAGRATQGVVDGAASAAAPAASTAAQGTVQATTGAAAPVAAPVAGAIPLNQFVPVKEVRGKLLKTTKKIEKNTKKIDKTTKSIDKTTKSMEELLVEICTYQKSVQRIQTDWEQRETVENTELRRQAGTQTERYRQELADLTQRGYRTTSPENPNGEGPLFSTNPRKQVNKEVIPEARRGYYDALKNSQDAFKDQTLAVLKQDDSQTDIPASTITKGEYDDFMNDRITDYTEWQKIFLAVNDSTKPNRPDTSILLNSQAIAKQEIQAEEDFLRDLSTGQGYLPIRECVTHATDGKTCLEWKTVTPGIQIKESNADSYRYRTELYTEPEPGDIAEGNAPTIDEVLQFNPSTSGGGGQTQGGGLDINALLDLLSGVVENRIHSEISFSFGLPSLNLLTQGSPNIATLRWNTRDLVSCTADNNWLTKNSNYVSLAKETGENLGIRGSANISLPLTFDGRLLRKRGDDITRTVTGATASSTNPTLTHQITTLTMPEDILPGDIFMIGFGPFWYEVNYAQVIVSEASTDQAGLVDTFKLAIEQIVSEENPDIIRRDEFKKYNFSYAPIDGKITITPKLNYKIKCVAEDNTIKEDAITIIR